MPRLSYLFIESPNRESLEEGDAQGSEVEEALRCFRGDNEQEDEEDC